MPLSNKQKPKNNITCNILMPLPFEPEPFVEKVLEHLSIQDASLEFTFFDNANIHEMNKTHLDHDWPTDIITFDLSESDDVRVSVIGSAETGIFSGANAPALSEEQAQKGSELNAPSASSLSEERDQKGGALLKNTSPFLGKAEKWALDGDIYISVEQAEIQAKTLHHPLEKELKILIIHGILHLLGYDDQTYEDQTEMDAKQLQIYDLLHTSV
jgi:probable rRNA maturation factor